MIDRLIFSLVAMIGLEKCCITSACLQWLCHSGERIVAPGPLICVWFVVEDEKDSVLAMKGQILHGALHGPVPLGILVGVKCELTIICFMGVAVRKTVASLCCHKCCRSAAVSIIIPRHTIVAGYYDITLVVRLSVRHTSVRPSVHPFFVSG